MVLLLRALIVLAAMAGSGTAASAQSTYVSAGLFGDIVRTSHSGPVGRTAGGAGEALGFALRAGTPLGTAWGVELEFARPGELERSATSGVSPAYLSQETLRRYEILPAPIVLPPIVYEVHSSARYTTLAVSLWYQQQLTGRVALAYLGGASFGRTATEFHVDVVAFPRALPSILPVPNSKLVEYGVRPMAGFESRIAMTERVHLVPGIRLHAENGLWLIRPSVALGWSF